MTYPIAFSTLACPDFTPAQIVEMAARFGYDLIEWRGGPEGHVQPSLSAADRAALRRSVEGAGLASLAVTAYTSFTSEDAAERAANVDDLRRYLDLAADLGADYVRAFLGHLPPGARPAAVQERAAECLEAAAPHAQAVGVGIAVEPHDDLVRSADAAPILALAPHPAVGAVWDLGNTYAAGEEPAEGLARLGERIVYLHVKDGRGRGEAWQLTRLGEGEVPLRSAFAMLLERGFAGAFDVEWERAWHPELDPPETALPHALAAVQALLSQANTAAPG